jgi:hypothetical protein
MEKPMKSRHFIFALSVLSAATALSYADAAPEDKAQETTPFIEYNNRISVFDPSHITYERTKNNALYAGVETWFTPAYNHKFHEMAEAEFRMGYNYFWNGRDHLTPFAGFGYFRAVQKEHGHRPKAICYGTLGVLYDHEFTKTFNLGLNVKAILGGAMGPGHNDWGGNPIGGIDVAMPITFRFGYKRHWDFRLEPFNIFLQGSQFWRDYVGFRSTFGYRF